MKTSVLRSIVMSVACASFMGIAAVASADDHGRRDNDRYQVSRDCDRGIGFRFDFQIGDRDRDRQREMDRRSDRDRDQGSKGDDRRSDRRHRD